MGVDTPRTMDITQGVRKAGLRLRSVAAGLLRKETGYFKERGSYLQKNSPLLV